jgi:hypothetical protein
VSTPIGIDLLKGKLAGPGIRKSGVVDDSFGRDVTENNNFHLRGQVYLTRQWVVTVGPFVNFGEGTKVSGVISGFTPGSYTQYGVSVDSTFRFSDRLSADIGYQFTQRESGVASGRCTQNVVSFSLRYAF